MDAPVKRFDRTAEDVGNIVALEHVNTTQNDQRLATLFYVGGLGGTRDPYMHVIDVNMWVNFGKQQFHMPTRTPQVLRGHTGVVVPDLEALKKRLAMVAERLQGTKFAWRAATDARWGDHVVATCPWGNNIRVHAPAQHFGRMRLGIPYVELGVPRGTAAGIVAFYRRVMHAPAQLLDEGGTAVASVTVGADQRLRFRETDAPIPEYDGHHVAIYVGDFSGPHRWLAERDLVTEESDAWQYRFVDIVDPDSGKRLFQLEHEVRSLTHPMYARPLMNRNPSQSQRDYDPGHDTFY